MQTQIIAHRGASAEAPENTMPAFELALEQGAQMLEFDVRPTLDGQIVVFHDDTTERWNGRPELLSSLTLDQVRKLDIGGGRVPTLDEVLAWAATTDLALNVEIKTPQIERDVAQIIRAHQLGERVIISSFDYGVLRAMREVAPELAIGVLMGTQSMAPHVRLREALPMPTLRAHGARAWHPAWQLPLLDQLIPRVRSAGYAVYVWTVDDPAVMRRLLQLNVDGIMTNRPALLRQVQSEWIAQQQAAT